MIPHEACRGRLLIRPHREKAGDVTNTSHVYELRVQGIASALLRAEFDDVEVTDGVGVTVLRTGWVDTAMLYGLIRRVESLGLVLVDVTELDGRRGARSAS